MSDQNAYRTKEEIDAWKEVDPLTTYPAALIEAGVMTQAPTAGRAMRAIIDKFKDVTVVDSQVTIMSRMKPSDMAALEALADKMLE